MFIVIKNNHYVNRRFLLTNALYVSVPKNQCNENMLVNIEFCGTCGFVLFVTPRHNLNDMFHIKSLF